MHPYTLFKKKPTCLVNLSCALKIFAFKIMFPFHTLPKFESNLFVYNLMDRTIMERVHKVPASGWRRAQNSCNCIAYISWHMRLKRACLCAGLRAQCRSVSCRTWWTGARWLAAEGGSSVPSSSTTARYHCFHKNIFMALLNSTLRCLVHTTLTARLCASFTLNVHMMRGGLISRASVWHFHIIGIN